jgi:hypothetical protein
MGRAPDRIWIAVRRAWPVRLVALLILSVDGQFFWATGGDAGVLLVPSRRPAVSRHCFPYVRDVSRCCTQLQAIKGEASDSGFPPSSQRTPCLASVFLAVPPATVAWGETWEFPAQDQRSTLESIQSARGRSRQPGSSRALS